MSLPGMPNLVPISLQPSASSSNPILSSHAAVSVTQPSIHSSSLPESSNATSDTCNDHEQIPYTMKPSALWHPHSGLVVSPNMTFIPETPENGLTQRVYAVPAMLNDSNIYLAFTPRFARNDGDLFGRLNLNREALYEKIVLTQDGKYILDMPILDAWSRLENALLDVCDTLLLSLNRRIPSLSYPKFPWQHGYRKAHDIQDIAFRCSLHAQMAFMNLSSLTTFTLSLYINETGSLKDAYSTLVRNSSYTVFRPWLDLLSSSYVCNLNTNFRVGGFIDPYTSSWIGFIPKFVQARIPIWIMWGHKHGIARPIDMSARRYFPPEQVIEEAKDRCSVSTSMILPTYRYDPWAINHADPEPFPQNDFSSSDEPIWSSAPFTDESLTMSSSMPAPSPPSSPYSSFVPIDPTPSSSLSGSTSLLQFEVSQKQRALAALESYFADLARRREARLKTETQTEKERRLQREELAKKGKRMNKSTLFIWEEQEDGSYVRQLVNSKQAEYEWDNFTRNQRRYASHLNQWDLCPQLPRYSEDCPKVAQDYNSDDSEYEFAADSSPPAAPGGRIHIPNDRYRANMNTAFAAEVRGDPNAMQGVESDADQLDAPRVERRFIFETFLQDRFGYDVTSPRNWSSKIEPAYDVKDIVLRKAMMALSCAETPAPDIQEAVIRLVKLLSNTTWTFKDLPASFDHSPSSEAHLSLTSDTLDIDVTSMGNSNDTLYLVHQKGYLDKCPWAIATLHASTVLLIFRKRWPTVEVIARELVQRGVPFKTIAATSNPRTPLRDPPSRGLGDRPHDYKPTHEDYLEYIRRRDDLLRGPKGRAALLHGGIIARIARDVLETDVVLDGPSAYARPVAHANRYALVDDELTTNDLDLISGVYFFMAKDARDDGSFRRGSRTEMSWWPQSHTWTSSACYFKMEWTDLAEEFYQKRLVKLQTPETALLNAKKWRTALRQNNAITKIIEIGLEHYQAGFFEEHYRGTRFVAPSRR